MREDIAIEIKNINKTFKVPHERHNSLKDKAVHIFGPRKFTKYQALKDINFDIKKGEFFGIIGKNGSGKSTLLKMIANIYQPTSGEINMNGSLSPFIELGVGFNTELTGRENVFLSGTILGLTKKKIESLYDEIVEFSEIGDFIDQKLKNYSSGMMVRLAFSIAVRADSDILLIDEVLAVGDAAFQAKCLDYFKELKSNKKTVVFVSHDMDAVRRFCDRAVLINDSKVVLEGTPDIVCPAYFKLNSSKNVSDAKGKSAKILKSVKVRTDQASKDSIFVSPKELSIDIEWKKNDRVKNVGLAIYTNEGDYCFGTNTKIDGFEVQGNKISLKMNKPQLAKGFYVVKIMLFEDKDDTPLEFIEDASRFKIDDETHRQGLIKLDAEWK